MRRVMMYVSLVMLVPMTLYAWRRGATSSEPPPRIDVVFCIDTTSSMDPFIAAVKDRVRQIMQSVLEWKAKPVVRLGVVAYRDRGDEYITRFEDLTNDVERIHKFLSDLRSRGGGDRQEHVTEALRVTVNELHWSEGPRTLKMVFLIGDAPTHLDYPDGDYKPIVKTAREKTVVIHTVACARVEDTIRQWKDIAELTGGQFHQLDSLSTSPSVTEELGRKIKESIEEKAKKEGFL